jgi:hypothetical protein
MLADSAVENRTAAAGNVPWPPLIPSVQAKTWSFLAGKTGSAAF